MKHLLSFEDVTTAELKALLDNAIELKKAHRAGQDPKALKDKVVALVFEKSSTRTRVSFETGIYHLGGQAVVVTSSGSQIARGEPTEDTARVMGRYCDMIMVRTFGQEVVEKYAKYAGVPIINGLTDLVHPCQLLADLMTLKEHGLDLATMAVAWIGDGNNMANSWIESAGHLGFKLTLAVPEGYEPDAAILARARARGNNNITIVHSPKEAAKEADVVTTDVWASMGQEAEKAKRAQDFKGFIVDEELLKVAKNGVKVLHCLPAHRGEEIAASVIESHPEIFDEAENRLHAQKQLMIWLMENR